MPYDPTLPIPAATDIDTRRPAEEPAWWSCRFCGFTESGPMTPYAEVRRCAAHEYRCPKRPADDVPGQHERAAYQFVHAANLRRELVRLSCNLDDRHALLRRTWFFDFSGRRAHRAAIDDLSSQVVGVHARALALGLSDGWDDPRFRPAALR
jgi:hypothetical protein